jgi:hypothetical protein
LQRPHISEKPLAFGGEPTRMFRYTASVISVVRIVSCQPNQSCRQIARWMGRPVVTPALMLTVAAMNPPWQMEPS